MGSTPLLRVPLPANGVTLPAKVITGGRVMSTAIPLAAPVPPLRTRTW